jgi:uncharacterized membrane protein HdeD (DUF308 family)
MIPLASPSPEKGEVMEPVYIGVKNWWSYLIRGVIAIAFGVILIAWPESTIKVLAYLVGILAILDGVIETAWAVYLAFKKEKMGLVLARGLFGLLVGILLLTKTNFTLTLVVILVGMWAVASGIIELMASFEMPPMSGRGLFAVGGALSIIIGILLLALPLQTVYAIIVIFCILLFVGGIIRLVFAFYARKYEKQIKAI